MAAQILTFDNNTPRIDPEAVIMDTAVIIGDVEIGSESSIWFGTVIRGDIYPIRIGQKTSVQDQAVIHVTGGMFSTTVGDRVVIGHRAVLHGCVVEDDCLIGMGSLILDGSVIGRGSMVAAGAVVTPGTVIEPGSLVLGTPAKAIRPVTQAETYRIQAGASAYVELAAAYKNGGSWPT